MKHFLLAISLFLICSVSAIAQFADPAVTGANYVPNEITIGQNALLTVSFANSGSTAIPVGSIELTISTAPTYYKSDGVTQPSGVGAGLFNWAYLGSDVWRGTNKVAVPAFGGGTITLTVKGSAVSPGFETTNVNVQPVNSFGSFNNAANNDNLQPKLKVNAAPAVPIANNDNATTPQNTPVTINSLANDVLNGGTSPVLSVVTPSPNGTASVVNGQFVFTPTTGFSGTTTFTYKITASNGVSNTATVTVVVPAPTPLPIANNDNATTPQNTAVTLTPLSNDVVNGTLQSINIVSQPANGSVVVSGNNFVFTPANGFKGTTTFPYTITTTNGTSNQATETIVVTAPTPLPIANNDNATTPQNTPVTITPLSNDVVNGVLQSITIKSQPANGTVILSGNNFVFTPANGFTGTTTFTYCITTTNGTSNTATETIVVTAPKPLPIANNDNATTPQNTAVTLTPLSNDVVNGTLQSINIISQPANGSVVVSGNNFVFTPANGFTGTTTFPYTITTTNGTSNQATETIVVIAPTPLPIANNDNTTTPQNTAVTIPVLANDNLNGGTSPVVSIVTQSPNGTATVSGNQIVFTPTTGFNGTTTLTYKITALNGVSNTATVTIKVQPATATGSIGDLTFNDNNDNGVYDTGDTPKSNILVTLCNSAGQTITTTLSVSGNYSFGGLTAGTYIVKFAPVHTDGKVLTTPQQVTVNLAAGQNFTSADAGYKTPSTPSNGSIGDLTFNDNNGNGVYDTGDTPKSNILVTLCNSAGQTITTTLSVSGNYSFGGLTAGTYIVKFAPVHTDGKVLTTPQQVTVNLAAGQNYTSADAGYKTPSTPSHGSIGDLTFNDNNGNGVYDTGDTPKSNILVTLCNSAGQTITTTLSVSGSYSFGGLTAGMYIVKFAPVHTDGKVLTTPQQVTVNLAAGQNYTSADAGYKTPNTPSNGSIGDIVFADNNNNGIHDSGDTPILGVTVSLCSSSNVLITSTTTNAAGNYSFSGLSAGTYIVKFPATLADGKSLTTPQQLTVNLAAGQNYVNADAGYFKPSTSGTSSIKDVFVYHDSNNNLSYDAGDSPIEGVTVTLCNANNQVITTAITNVDGAYSFLNLAAGTYIVKFPAILADGKTISTTNPITITLGTGETSSAADAGYYQSTTTDCSAKRDNSIIRTCSNGVPVLTGTALAGYEYQWLSSTSVCPNNSTQAISGATEQNYTLPSNVSELTYFMRCARPIGCTSWDAVTESNCLTINASDCSSTAPKCDAVIVKGNTNGTISVTGLGSYTCFIQVFNSQWQTVSNQEYNQSEVSIPIKNGTYRVNVLLYDANSGGWIFLCEKTVSVIVSGGLNALSKNMVLDINAFAEAQRAQIQWVNNTGSQNDFFTVEKLNNVSGNFEKIETVNSKPTEGNEAYSIYDNAITEGDNTYRVQLTMLDGQVKTSALKTLTYKNLNDVRIYPNPASDFIEVDLKQYEGKKVTLYIYNQVGKIIHTQQVERASATPIHLDMERQTSGQMLLRVVAEGYREVTKKFVIQN